MSLVKNMLRPVFDTPFGDRVRTAIGYRPPVTMRPTHAHATLSDLFVWRLDDTWETAFDLVNVPSLIFPDWDLSDRATIVVFTDDGQEILRETFELEPLATKLLPLAELIDGFPGNHGTFSVFHHNSRAEKALASAKSHMAERGYVRYRRRGDKLWGIMHGNLHGVAHQHGSSQIFTVHGRLKEPAVYRVQADMSDCDRFDVALTNPSPQNQTATVAFLDAKRTEIDRTIRDIAPGGVAVVSWDNSAASCAMIECHGRLAMWRPALFKHYESHFNVLHS